MSERTIPPKIEFYEEDPQRTSPLFSSALTRFVRTASFGLIKNDTQAGVVIILVLAAFGAGAYYFITHQKTVEPTTYHELLPQETVGSEQGLPPQQLYEE